MGAGRTGAKVAPCLPVNAASSQRKIGGGLHEYLRRSEFMQKAFLFSQAPGRALREYYNNEETGAAPNLPLYR